jgi:DNA-binding response OmpR family regulator
LRSWFKVQAAGELVNKNDIMDRVWPGAIIEDNTLQFQISVIRKALGSDSAMLGCWRSRPSNLNFLGSSV